MFEDYDQLFWDYYLHERESLEEHNRFYQDHLKIIEKAKKIAVDIISYPNFSSSYEYVDSLFKGANILKVVIYKLSASQMEKLGFGFAEGLYDIPTKTVIIGGNRKFCNKEDVIVEVERDEVIVHELLHYAYMAEGMNTSSVEMAEEFAYGWSVGYMRQKGHSDDHIIEKYCLPHFIGVSQQNALKEILAQNSISEKEFNNMNRYDKKDFYKKFSNRLMEMSKELGREKAREMIRIYNKKLEDGSHCSSDVNIVSRFDLLDF